MPERLKQALVKEVDGRKFTPRKISIDGAIQAGIALWLASAASSPKSAPDTGYLTDTGITNSQLPATPVKSPEGQIEYVSAQEWHRVRQILKILRGDVPQAIAPLMTNLDSFEYLTDLVRGKGQGHGGKGPQVPGSPSGIAREVEELRNAQAELDRQLEEAQRAAEDAGGTGKKVRRTGTGDKGGNTRRS